MKVLHLTFGFAPDPIGGTEVYVIALARLQRAGGVDAQIAAPSERDLHFDLNGLPVHRYAKSPDPSLEELYGHGDIVAAERFLEVLNRVRPDVVHMHAFTSGVSLLVARSAKQVGAIVVFTYHAPTVTCQRGSLLRWGKSVCSGDLAVEPCAGCEIQSHRIPKRIAQLLSASGPALAPVGKRLGAGKLATALQLPTLVGARIQAFQELRDVVDRWVAVCGWVGELLRVNQIPEERILLSRQGVFERFAGTRNQSTGVTLRLAFAGRLDRMKGLDVLLRGLRLVPDLDCQLDCFLIDHGDDSEYASELDHALRIEPRSQRIDGLSGTGLLSALATYDAVVVPSQWLETGPLVVLEAFEVGVPVVGSALGGIAELVTNDRDGILVDDWRNAAAWAVALLALTEPSTREKLRRGVRRPRGMEDVTRDMSQLYAPLVAAPARASTDLQ